MNKQFICWKKYPDISLVENEYVNTAQAAQYLGVSPNELRMWYFTEFNLVPKVENGGYMWSMDKIREILIKR